MVPAPGPLGNGSEGMTMTGVTIETAQLRLRPWRSEDLAPFATLNADPAVMEYFPKTLDRAESDAVVGRIDAHFAEHGFGFWAVEIKDGPFIGLVGLVVPRWTAAFTPCVEIGWRLAAAYWGCGYASEAAAAALDHGFDVLGLNEIVACTLPGNRRSRAVMERLGMRRSAADDFDHPSVPAGHLMTRHVLYRIDAATRRAAGIAEASRS
jgi:RimJ/RimL family protein N-acetyltransferase